MSSSNELTDFIEKLVQERTFNLEALNSINELKAKAANLQEDLENTNRRNSDYLKTISEQSLEIKAKDTEISRWSNREDELVKRESQITALERRVAVAEASTIAFERATSMFLKNTVIREQLTHNISTPVPINGYVQNHLSTDSKTTVRSAEAE